MIFSLKRSVLAVAFLASTLSLHGQPGLSPHDLIEKAIALRESSKVLPRYTYFMLDHTVNRTAKGKRFVNYVTLYEYTWIGDLPYGRVVEAQGKPLKGKALRLEQARYDKAVADRAGLDVEVRAKATHASVVDTGVYLDPLVTPDYALRELRQETLDDNVAHVIDCTPISFADSTKPAATRHVTLWITDAGVILRQAYELVADETDKMRGSHGQHDFQLVDGNRLPLHETDHLNAPNGNTGDFEKIYSRFRRFSASVTIVPASDPAKAPSSSPSPQR